MIEGKTVLLGMTEGEMREAAELAGLPRFVGSQMAQWIYGRRVRHISEMTNISLRNRAVLEERFDVGAMEPIDCQRSVDGTVKYLFPVRTVSPSSEAGRKMVETVFIPDGDRATLCVSCQVGCKMNCLFCQTGKQGWHGDLSAADILNQVYSLPEAGRLTNIVFMGQGEPMDNLDNVLRATAVLTDGHGWGWSPRRITVSTVGVRGKLELFLRESECHVAVSLHSPLPDERRRLMPAEGAMSIAETVDLLRGFDFSGQRRCSFEYICFGGLNDTMQHARALTRLLGGLRCRVNIIRFHAIPSVDLPATDEERMLRFRDYLTRHGIFATIRASRGEDILAACGLLSTARQRYGEENRTDRTHQET